MNNNTEKSPSNFLSMPFNTASNSLSNAASSIKEITTGIKRFSNLLKHLHTCHEHPCDHFYSGIEITNHLKSHGDPLFLDPENVNRSNELLPHFISNVPVNSLTREYSHSVDCDNNGLIFGKDFIFSLNDKNVPKILFAIQRMQNSDITIKRITWKEFLNTVSSNTFV